MPRINEGGAKKAKKVVKARGAAAPGSHYTKYGYPGNPANRSLGAFDAYNARVLRAQGAPVHANPPATGKKMTKVPVPKMKMHVVEKASAKSIRQWGRQFSTKGKRT